MPNQFFAKTGFAVGTGRCGTTFLYRVLRQEPQVAASHERNRLLESFHKYCCWNELAVDEAGFLAEKEREISEDLAGAEISFESSGHLSLSIPSLYEHFQARFVLLVRNPLAVVASYVRKGYYQDRYVQRDTTLALGYQPGQAFHHYLGRIVPRGDQFQRWNDMTQVGKVAWFWKALNQRTLELLEPIPQEHRAIVRIEDLDFERYQSVTQMLGFDSALDEQQFNGLRNLRPNSSASSLQLPSWSADEISEFENEVGDLAAELGYPASFGECVSQTEIRKPSAAGRRPFFTRLRG
jgi:hypothetical protein